MREIKFRAWDGERMFSHDQMRNFDFYHWCESPDVTIMQYTGLKDRNSKDIYEGDVVKVYGQFEIPFDDKKDFEIITYGF